MHQYQTFKYAHVIVYYHNVHCRLRTLFPYVVWSTFAQFNIVLIQYRFEGQGLSLQIYTNEEKLITTYSEWRRNAATAWQL
jgi:hypothetical protein